MSRRSGNRRGLRSGGRRSLSVDLRALGTFTRSGEGSYLTGAATDGSSAFMAFAATDVRRFEDRGDGAGALLLLERASTCLIKQNSDITNAAAWTLPLSGATQTADAGPAPDGTTTADRVQSAGAQFSRGQNPTGAANPHTVSCYGRATSGTSIWAANYAATTAWNVAALTTTWSRRSVLRAGAVSTFYPVDSSLPSGSPQDVRVVFAQAEDGRYPTSVIRTAAANVTRGADSLEIGTAQLPAALFTRAFKLRQVSPNFANTDLVSGDVRWLFTIGGSSDGVRIRHDGSNVKIEAVQGGSVKASSGNLTFARYALLGEVSWDPVTAVIRVGGVAGAAGTPWTWSAGTVRVGGIQGSSGSELDGRVYPVMEAA